MNTHVHQTTKVLDWPIPTDNDLSTTLLFHEWLKNESICALILMSEFISLFRFCFLFSSLSFFLSF